MTARERADRVLKAMESYGFLDGPPDTLAMNVVALLGHAGLVLVDRELHEALVQAVRAVEWVRLVADHADEIDEWHGDPEAAPAAHARAVALLAERGE